MLTSRPRTSSSSSEVQCEQCGAPVPGLKSWDCIKCSKVVCSACPVFQISNAKEGFDYVCQECFNSALRTVVPVAPPPLPPTPQQEVVVAAPPLLFTRLQFSRYKGKRLSELYVGARQHRNFVVVLSRQSATNIEYQSSSRRIGNDFRIQVGLARELLKRPPKARRTNLHRVCRKPKRWC